MIWGKSRRASVPPADDVATGSEPDVTSPEVTAPTAMNDELSEENDYSEPSFQWGLRPSSLTEPEPVPASVFVKAIDSPQLTPAAEPFSADLDSADLDSADLDSADLDSADLDSADLDSADLDSAERNNNVSSAAAADNNQSVARPNAEVDRPAEELPNQEVIVDTDSAGEVSSEPALRPYYPPPRVNAERFDVDPEAVEPEAVDPEAVEPAAVDLPVDSDPTAPAEPATAEPAPAAPDAEALSAAIPALIEPAAFGVGGFVVDESHPVTAPLTMQEVLDSPSPRRAAREAERQVATATGLLRLDTIAAAVAAAASANASANASPNANAGSGAAGASSTDYSALAPAPAPAPAPQASSPVSAFSAPLISSPAISAFTTPAATEQPGWDPFGASSTVAPVESAEMAQAQATASEPATGAGVSTDQKETNSPMSSRQLSTAQKVVLWVTLAVVLVAIMVVLFLVGNRIIGPSTAAASIASPSVSATVAGSAVASPTVSPVVAPIAAVAQSAEPTAAPAAPGEHPWNELNGGECLQQFSDAWAPRMLVVACTAPHTAQLVLRSTFSDSSTSYPGASILQAKVAELCSRSDTLKPLDSLADVVMQASFASNAAAWTAGDHGFRCFVSRLSGDVLPGSVAIQY